MVVARSRGKMLAEARAKKQAVQTERLEAMESSIADLKAMLAEVRGKIMHKSETSGLPIATAPDARLKAFKDARLGQVNSSRRVQDLTHPGAAETGFQPDDVVALKEETEKARLIRKNLKDGSGAPVIGPDQPIIGVVTGYQFTTQGGLRKYKVYVPQVTKRDGWTEDDMVLLERKV